MQVRLLGPVEVVIDGTARPVSGARRKAVLALLALHPGEVVGVGRLIDAVWGEHPPRTAVNTLQSHISHLRRILGGAAAIRVRPPGYVLDMDGDVTDVQAAESLVRRAMRSGDRFQRAQHLRSALAMWRGRPLADVTGLEEEAAYLERRRLEAGLTLAETRLELGEHSQLVSDLERLVRDHPYDERIHARLMLALYRSGRQAEALAAYRGLRRTLDGDLGIHPGRALRELEAAILRQDLALDLHHAQEIREVREVREALAAR